MLLVRRFLLFSVLATACSSLAVACSCENDVPIQRTYGRYAERAVFTARVVQSMGNVYNFDGRRSSDKVLAVVDHRYWGLPWYWPTVVVLDGSYPCDIAMRDGEAYLVSGRLSRYGVLEVNGCSRTQPVRSAQIDMRTLDGSRCAAPGGTILGRISQAGKTKGEPDPVLNATLTFRDSRGKPYPTHSDVDGFYELQHLPPGPYTLDSQLDQDRFITGTAFVTSGRCSESPLVVYRYSVTGRLIPGINQHAQVMLGRIQEGSPVFRPGLITPDGRFYFADVGPGEYYLVVSVSLVGRPDQRSEVYYPGTSIKSKAVAIRISSERLNKSFDFDPSGLPLVPIPINVESPDPSSPIPIEIHSQNSNGIIVADLRSVTGVPVSILGVRGDSYGISLYGYGDEKEDVPDRRSEIVQVIATPGMKPVTMSFTARR